MASAFGLAPKKSFGCQRNGMFPPPRPFRVSITLDVSLPAFATQRWRPFGSVAAQKNAADHDFMMISRPSINDGYRSSFAMSERDRPEPSFLARQSGDGGGVRTPPRPIAHISFVACQDDIIGSSAGVEEAQNLACGDIQFQQAVGKISATYRRLPSREIGQASRDISFASRRVGISRGIVRKAGDLMSGIDANP